ncbi:DUF4292 domain-containing protein [Emticicia sp. CRIBPO]|uniref:DUF4292 domain-containing protein n=1 Tax=Emticicia sp. CRIBPO TaxID=2683258 RepID=UPI001412EA22|nr:DUF4292 domain-containing protein [Emticicia sp. CRIBPO]NBA85234.1 DUF4292 domain-containing protein [Emticicia sp. CRIBPO]
MKNNRLFATAAALFISLGSFAQTAEEIVEKHVAALGSPDKIQSVKTIVTDLSLSIQGNEVPIKTQLIVGKSVRSESTIMGNAMVQVLDGTTSWMIRPAMMGGTGDPEDMPADQIKQLQGQLDPFGPLYNYKQKENKVELIGKEKVDKKDAFHLKITTKDGTTIDQYIDAATYMVVKSTVAANGQNVEVSYSDFKEVEGLKFPHTLEMSSPMGALAIITNKIKINPTIDEAVFKRPK